ncbi:MAG: ABC transporter substrate-binding protein [Thermodesulfobacteriota bacterium]|nr:ABC transporter substrate-binding protein [Thermodesulfobacteriota bacterium]
MGVSVRFFFRQSFFILCIIFAFTQGAECRSYRIATVAWIGWSPLHVAAANGFWDGLGVDVAVVDYDDPIVILEAIKAKKIDLAMDMVGSLVGIYMKGEPVVAIAETNWSHGGDKIIVREGDCLKNHKNDVLGVFLKQPSCLFFLDRYLQQVNLQLSDFRIVEVNSYDLSAQFIAGRLPAIVNYEPWANEAVRHGNGEVLATSADFRGCIPECMWGYRQVIGRIPDEDIHNILRGWIKAVRWLKDPANREAYFQILREKTFRTKADLTDEEISAMLKNVAIHYADTLYERNRNAGGLFGYLQALKGFLERNDMLQKNFVPADVFDNQWICHVLMAS